MRTDFTPSKNPIFGDGILRPDGFIEPGFGSVLVPVEDFLELSSRKATLPFSCASEP